MILLILNGDDGLAYLPEVFGYAIHCNHLEQIIIFIPTQHMKSPWKTWLISADLKHNICQPNPVYSDVTKVAKRKQKKNLTKSGDTCMAYVKLM